MKKMEKKRRQTVGKRMKNTYSEDPLLEPPPAMPDDPFEIRLQKDLERRKWRARMERLKIGSNATAKIPKTYHGNDNVMEFYQFCQSANEYFEQTGLVYVPELLVNRLSQFLSGKAYKFYMANKTSPNPVTNLQDFYKALMNSCFPPNFLQREREKYEKFEQREMDIQTYLNELQFRHTIIGGKDPQDVVRRAWHGCHREYQAKLWEKGLNPEFSSLSEVRDELLLIEKAAQYRRAMDGVSRREREMRSGHVRKDTRRHVHNHGHPSPSSSSHNFPRPTHHVKSKTTYKPTQKPSKMNNKIPKAQLSAQNRCFECQEEGHYARDCPKTNRLRRGITANAATPYTEIERMGELSKHPQRIVIETEEQQEENDEGVTLGSIFPIHCSYADFSIETDKTSEAPSSVDDLKKLNKNKSYKVDPTSPVFSSCPFLSSEMRVPGLHYPLG